MTECPKCRRPIVTYEQFCEGGATAWHCCGENDLTCPVIVDAYQRGRASAFADAIGACTDTELVDLDPAWRYAAVCCREMIEMRAGLRDPETGAELARRVGGGS
jgi:hypothetical protein